MVLVVEHAEPPPHGYVERVQGLLNAYRAQVLAGCAILEARGFAAAVQRAAGTAILSMSRMRGRLAIHESVESAVPWLTERLLPQAERLERGRELRALLAPSRSPGTP